MTSSLPPRPGPGRAELSAALRALPVVPVPDDVARARAAVGVVVVPAQDSYGVLLTLRAATLRQHSGQFALPGGRMDPGETAEETARRELAEELGVTVGPDAVLGRLDDYVTRSGFAITPVVLWAGDEPVRLVPSPAEVAQVFVVSWAELDVVPNLLTIPESDAPVLQLPIVGTMVHAPTAAVLYQFSEVCLRGRQTRVSHFEQPVFAWR